MRFFGFPLTKNLLLVFFVLPTEEWGMGKRRCSRTSPRLKEKRGAHKSENKNRQRPTNGPTKNPQQGTLRGDHTRGAYKGTPGEGSVSLLRIRSPIGLKDPAEKKGVHTIPFRDSPMVFGGRKIRQKVTSVLQGRHRESTKLPRKCYVVVDGLPCAGCAGCARCRK